MALRQVEIDDTDEAPASKFGALSPAGEYVTAQPKKAAQPSEPTMKALRRILGDSVLDIFPQALIDSVEASYQYWRANPDSYLPSLFDNPEDLADSLTVMRAYAECADNGGYTIRRLADDNPCMLVWRAQTRRGSKDDN